MFKPYINSCDTLILFSYRDIIIINLLTKQQCLPYQLPAHSSYCGPLLISIVFRLPAFSLRNFWIPLISSEHPHSPVPRQSVVCILDRSTVSTELELRNTAFPLYYSGSSLLGGAGLQHSQSGYKRQARVTHWRCD